MTHNIIVIKYMKCHLNLLPTVNTIYIPNNQLYTLPLTYSSLSLRRKFVLRPIDLVYYNSLLLYYPRQAVHSLDLGFYYLLKIKHRYMKQETMGFVMPINKEQMKELTKRNKRNTCSTCIRCSWNQPFIRFS